MLVAPGPGISLRTNSGQKINRQMKFDFSYVRLKKDLITSNTSRRTRTIRRNIDWADRRDRAGTGGDNSRLKAEI